MAAYQLETTSSAKPVAPNDAVLSSHLLRRAGFGLAPGELDQWARLNWDDAVDRLVDYEKISNQALEDRLIALKLDLTKAADIQRWWLTRMISTARPLEEKMTLFWHGLLTSALTKAKAPEMLAQNKFLRSNALGDYGTILKGITRDPAMMHWLDTVTNRKGHANENYSRELMELFTMGPGHYTEQDVRESARAFTGLAVRNGQTVLVKNQHDDGFKTFLGQTGNWGPDDIINIILDQQVTADFLATKLLRFFLSLNPPDSAVKTIADTLRQTHYSTKEAMRTLLKMPELRDPSSVRALIKSPAEYVAGALRQLGQPTASAFVPRALGPMGQVLFNPPNVAGWPGGTTWLNSGTWLARLNFANQVTTSRSQIQLDPKSWFSGSPASTTSEFVGKLADHLVDGSISDDQRQMLVGFAGSDSDFQRDQEHWFDGTGRAVVYLLLALPEYHLN